MWKVIGPEVESVRRRLAQSFGVDPEEIAITRIAIPRAKVRLSAGRTNLNKEAQTLCFFAGANSIFYGDKLLTAANPRANEDMKLLHELGLAPLEPNPALEAPESMDGVPLNPGSR